MWKIIGILLLTVLVGCGQTQSASSTQPSTGQSKENTSDEQRDTDQKNVNFKKEVEEKEIYAGVFDDSTDGIKPNTIKIESIGVNGSVEHVGLQENGKMDVPKNPQHAAWYDLGAKPGERGSAVIAGHVNSPKGKAVFWDLHKLKTGDEVKISNADGETLVFEVVGKKAFDLGEAPVEKIFGYTSRRMLNLITCTGKYNYDIGTHEQRLVVYTELKKAKE